MRSCCAAPPWRSTAAWWSTPIPCGHRWRAALILGLGTALYNQITLANGAVAQSNFHDYRALRMNEAPAIDVHLVPSQEKPGGVGEAGTAAAAPALGNAIFAATGKRVRRLPFIATDLGGA